MSEDEVPPKKGRPRKPTPQALAFGARFQILIDRAPWSLHHDGGRYSEIAKRLSDVGFPGNREIVRRWALGQSMPGPDAIRALGRLYNVDYRWLAYGPEFGEDLVPPPQKNIAREIDIGRHLIIANVAISGAEVVEVPPVGFEHIRARIKGAEYIFHGVVGQITREGCQFVLPQAASSTLPVGFEPGPPGSFKMLRLDWAAVERFGTKFGELVRVIVPRDRQSEDYRWHKITTFAQRL